MKPFALSQSAAVHYTVSIHEADGRLVRRLPRKRNLILDQGLDGIAVRSWSQSFVAAAVGTGTTPTKRDSGAVTFTRAGNVVTASAGFFEAADVGRLLKWDSGEEVRITAFTDAQTVTTSTSGTIAAGEGTVWYVNQTALVAEVKRSQTYSNDGGANGSTYADGVRTHKRTFLFSAEAGPVTYREIGWSHTTTGGANLFGRDLLPGVGVTLVATQILRVVVELSVAYSPISATPYASIATGGWTSDGECSLENMSAASNVDPDGTSSNVTVNTSLEPSSANTICISTDATAIRAAGTGAAPLTVLASAVATLGSYAAGSFTRVKTATFGVSTGNSAAIRSIAFLSGSNSVFRVLLDSAEAKTSSQTLTIGFTYSWRRVLSNA